MVFTIASTVLFHASDNVAYSGYSRFNLFILPMILGVAAEPLRKLKVLSGGIFWLFMAGFCCLNLYLSPVAIDGAKKPFWGNYLCDTSEHYYPYRKTIKWIGENYPEARVLFAGLTYPYYTDFYFEKFNLNNRRLLIKHPKKSLTAARAFATAVKIAQQNRYQLIVFHVIDDIPAPGINQKYALEKTFTNSAHRLALYRHREADPNYQKKEN